MGVERRGRVIRGCVRSINRTFSGRSRVSELKSSDKPFAISKREVWEAYQKVKRTRVRREWMRSRSPTSRPI